jgi:hypothetical protein
MQALLRKRRQKSAVVVESGAESAMARLFGDSP